MANQLDLVFLWHMHQPDYRGPRQGDLILPWTYLHAIKDYTDMAAHLERHPDVRCVVNLVPVLLDQLEDYAAQIAQQKLRDPLLRLLISATPLTPAEKRFAIDACFRTNHDRTVAPFPPFQRLHALYEVARTQGESTLEWLSDRYFLDLVTWFHLAWTGESERRRNPRIAALMSKGEGYTQEERLELLALMGEIIAGIVPRYRALAEAGQIELSTSPQAHPIAPLLLSFDCAKEALPELVLPGAQHYPGGSDRLQRQMASALASHRARFGRIPTGCWPSEGAVSAPSVAAFARSGLRWLASGEGVLAHSLEKHGKGYDRARDLYRPWQAEGGITMFFRDDALSDLIGFEYAKWHGKDAARHFVGRLQDIMETASMEDVPLVCVMLDGENAWEYYPYNAWYFFEELYALLAAQSAIRTCTLNEVLDRHRTRSDTLPGVVAGSWVYGTLSTWIGDPAKNHAWDLLVSAKQAYDLRVDALAENPVRAARADALLTTLEGSDWFWWLGADNPPEASASFEALFRHTLQALYATLELPMPVQLEASPEQGGGSFEGSGAMRRSGVEARS